MRDAIRQWERRKTDVPVCVVVQKEFRTMLISGRLKDLSETGAGVFAGVELKLNTEIQIEFTPAFDGVPLRVRAVVRNRRGYLYGMEFSAQNAAEEDALALLKAVLMPTATIAPGTVEDRGRGK